MADGKAWMGGRPPRRQTSLAADRVASFDPPASAWSAAEPLPETRPLEGDRRADVAVVGAGYTGLSAALPLAEHGDALLFERGDSRLDL